MTKVGSSALDVITRVVRSGAELRGKRLFHPHGLVFDAVFEVAVPMNSGVPVLDRRGTHQALVRVSKAASTPGRLPDVLGLAVRVHDADGAGHALDLALASTGRLPVLRHLLLPRESFTAAFYSSLLPYRIGEQHRLIGAEAIDRDTQVTADLADLAKAGPLDFGICLASPMGPWRNVGTLKLIARTGDDPSFDVMANSLPRFHPVGWLNRVRGPAYRASQRGRRAPEDRSTA